MKAPIALLLVLLVLVPAGAANRDHWVATGTGEANRCTSSYLVLMERAEPGTFRWNIDITIATPNNGTSGDPSGACGIRTREFRDVVSGDGGPWLYSQKTPAPCATESYLSIGQVPLEQGGPIALEYRLLRPCEGVFDVGRGTLVAATPDLVNCISLLCSVR